MNKDQGSGILERTIYGVVVFLVIRYGGSLGLTESDAAWIAGGALTLLGGAYAWWRNRPVSVLNRAGEAIPKNTELAIVPKPEATALDRVAAIELAAAASDKVVARPA